MSELATLYGFAEADLAAAGITPSFAFGRREVSKQINQGAGRANRIVWFEGAPEGDSGKEAAPRYPGQTPRSLKDALELFTIYVWAWDATAPTNDLAQHEAAWAAFCALRAVLFTRAEGRLTIESRRWKSPERVERLFGKELELICTIRSPIVELPITAGTDAAPLHSTTAVTENGVTNTVTT